MSSVSKSQDVFRFFGQSHWNLHPSSHGLLSFPRRLLRLSDVFQAPGPKTDTARFIEVKAPVSRPNAHGVFQCVTAWRTCCVGFESARFARRRPWLPWYRFERTSPIDLKFRSGVEGRAKWQCYVHLFVSGSSACSPLPLHCVCRRTSTLGKQIKQR